MEVCHVWVPGLLFGEVGPGKPSTQRLHTLPCMYMYGMQKEGRVGHIDM